MVFQEAKTWREKLSAFVDGWREGESGMEQGQFGVIAFKIISSCAEMTR